MEERTKEQDMTAHAQDILNSGLDTKALREVLGQFATGVAVVTTLGDNGVPVGMAVNSFASVSLDPPLVLWSIALNSPSLGAFRSHGTFIVNIMGDDGKDQALNFATPSDEKFKHINWRPGICGAPILDDAAAFLECEMESRINAGDHEIYIGRVRRFAGSQKTPLLFHRGQFNQLGSTV